MSCYSPHQPIRLCSGSFCYMLDLVSHHTCWALYIPVPLLACELQKCTAAKTWQSLMEVNFVAKVLCEWKQMATLSGRVPVWPDFACDSPWLEDEGEREKRKGDEGEGWFGATWRTDLEIVPRQPIDALPSQRRCLVWHYYEADCDAHVSFCPLSAFSFCWELLASVEPFCCYMPLMHSSCVNHNLHVPNSRSRKEVLL